MKFQKIIFPVAIGAVLTFTMCDYVTNPHDIGDIVITADTNMRVAIIEEWTGHTCIACPAAAADIDTLEGIYGDNFIAISIHDDYFAEPCPPHPTPNCATGHPLAFAEDFRCATGASYTAAHPSGPASPPQGMVNRKYMPSNNEVLTRGQWPAIVDSIVHDSAYSTVHLTHNYNTSTRQLSLSVWGSWLKAPYTGTVNVAIMITESGMVAWQTNGTACDSAFTFKHVLRDCINTPGSITGDQVFTGTSVVGTTWSYTLPAAYTVSSSWNDANCHLIAIFYDTVTGEVLNACEEEL